VTDSPTGQVQQLFVGEGELPPDLDRPNYGAALVIFLWVWLWGLRRWAVGLTALLVALVIVENVLLLSLDPQFVLLTLHYYVAALAIPFWWVAQYRLGLDANRMLWERERKRFDECAGDPPRPIPLARYRESVALWTRVGLAFLALGVFGDVMLLVSHPDSMPSVLTSWPGSVVPVAAVFVVDTLKRRRSQAVST
jgi:hypothetical protein